MLISAIISNFNGARFLPRLIASLREQHGVEVEIIVVDRQSTDGSAEILSAHPDIRQLSEPPETGLVSGYAAGARIAKSDLLFFCNEDMWFAPDCLSRLAARIDLASKVCAVDGWHWTYDGGEWLHGGTRFTAARWAINSPHPRRAANFQVSVEAGALVPFPCAGAFLMHATAYRDIGGWDTGFFLDHEDIDLFLRAWQRGWRCVSEPAARIHHAVNASNNQTLTSINQTVGQRRYVSQRANMAVIALKYFPAPLVLLAALQWPVVLANNLVKGCFRRAVWDLKVAREIAGRWADALVFRKANAPYNHYFPGDRFFTAPEFSDGK